MLACRLVSMAAALVLCAAVAGCGAATGGGVPPADPQLLRHMIATRHVPAVTFNGCVIPAGRPTWANILLTGAKGPFRATWSVDGKVDSSDPQRTIAVPGKGTRVEILLTLRGVGQTIRIQVFDARGAVGTYSFTNAVAGDVPCNPDGEPDRGNSG